MLFTPEMRELVNSRIATMERLDDDESAVARVIGHELALEFVADHPLGAGIGQTDPKMEQYISMRDSVVAASLVQFGLFGTLSRTVAAMCGLLVLLLDLLPYRAPASRAQRWPRPGLGLLAIDVVQRRHRRPDRRLPVDDRRPGHPRSRDCAAARDRVRSRRARGRCRSSPSRRPA